MYHLEMVNDVFFLISGTDFEEFSDIKVHFNMEEDAAEQFIKENPPHAKYQVHYSKSKKIVFECSKVLIDSTFEPDP